MATSFPDPSSTRGATFAEKPAFDADGPSEPPAVGRETARIARLTETLGRLATVVAVLTAPLLFLVTYRVFGWSLTAAIVMTCVGVFALRGLFDVVVRWFIPTPTLYQEDRELRAASVTRRRRAWFWRSLWRLVAVLAVVAGLLVGVTYVVTAIAGDATWADSAKTIFGPIADQFQGSDNVANIVGFAIFLAFFLIGNVLILLYPMLYAGMRQIQFFEPGDANWGVQMDDVRGQAGPKDEVRKIVQLWQAGDEFERSGGKRERGVLFLGPPGTGKTMLGKAVATGFNSPIAVAPGPAFAQTFIGVDVLLVMWMSWKARRLARKWGGQCLVFIDEIDVVGMRRTALGTPTRGATYHGSRGSITSTGDLFAESEAWREYVFAQRASSLRQPSPVARLAGRVQDFIAPGGNLGFGQGGLQSLLVAMDGVQNPPAFRRIVTNRLNTILDATYVIPPRIGTVPLRLPPVRPRREQLYFIGACNVPLESLDPALTRAGRMGRHVRFRTPNLAARQDLFDYYLGRVAREAEIDRPERREELAGIAMGHSPAMIHQVCSLALTYAHHDGRAAVGWQDLLDAIVVVEEGLDTGLTYVPDEARALAIHESGHAVTGHFFMKNHTSSRLTITPRDRGLGHHAMREVQERFSGFQHEQFAEMIWTLGAMAAEVVFYGETSTGVGGDIAAATGQAATMVGQWGMAPRRPDLSDRISSADARATAQRELMDRYEQLGLRLMNRTSRATATDPDPVASVLDDPTKRTAVAQLLGQAFLTAYWFVRHNRSGVERVAETLLERRDLYGSQVVNLLTSVNLELPAVDPLDESQWPTL
jgi:ATP-dependent Zn protease